jgi:hypothetical protein
LKHDVLFARTLDTRDGYKFIHVILQCQILFSRRPKASCHPKIFTAPSFTTSRNGEVKAIVRAFAGCAVTVLEEIRAQLGINHDHIVYMGTVLTCR